MAGWSRVLIAGVLVVGGCGGSDPKPRASATPSASLPAAVPAGSRVQATLSLDGGPDWMATDGQYVFVKRDSGLVTAIDPKSGRVAFTVPVPTALCQGVGAGFGSVWTCAANQAAGSDDVVRIDPRTKRITATVTAGKSESSGRIVTGHGRVWVVSAAAPTELLGIDPATNQVVDRIPLGVVVNVIAVDDSGVWAVSTHSGQVLRIDPVKGAVADRYEGFERPVAIAPGERIWVALGSSTVALDRATGTVAVTVPVGVGTDGALSLGEGALWIRSKDPVLTRVDVATGTVAERLTLPTVTSIGDVLVAFGSVWTSGSEDDVVLRIATH